MQIISRVLVKLYLVYKMLQLFAARVRLGSHNNLSHA